MNQFGDVLGLYNTSGTLVVKYLYDPWGKLEKVTDQRGNTVTDAESIALRNPFRYRGYYYDTDTGWYYLNSRYYDPETGRFVNADGYASTGQGFVGNNMFAYCNNNPVMMKDSTGSAPTYTVVLNDGSKRTGYLIQDVRMMQQSGMVKDYYADIVFPNGGTIDSPVVAKKQMHVSVRRTSIRYYTPEQAKDLYIEKSKAISGPSAADAASWTAGVILSTKPIADKVPYLGPLLMVGDGMRLYSGFANKMALDEYEAVMNQGKGVIAVAWDIEGDPRAISSGVHYYPWDGSSGYGAYPYATP